MLYMLIQTVHSMYLQNKERTNCSFYVFTKQRADKLFILCIYKTRSGKKTKTWSS